MKKLTGAEMITKMRKQAVEQMNESLFFGGKYQGFEYAEQELEFVDEPIKHLKKQLEKISDRNDEYWKGFKWALEASIKSLENLG